MSSSNLFLKGVPQIVPSVWSRWAFPFWDFDQQPPAIHYPIVLTREWFLFLIILVISSNRRFTSITITSQLSQDFLPVFLLIFSFPLGFFQNRTQPLLYAEEKMFRQSVSRFLWEMSHSLFQGPIYPAFTCTTVPLVVEEEEEEEEEEVQEDE